jgi:hypothetical protein
LVIQAQHGGSSANGAISSGSGKNERRGELQSGARDAQLGAAFLLAPAKRRAGEADEGRGFPLFLQIGGKERGARKSFCEIGMKALYSR